MSLRGKNIKATVFYQDLLRDIFSVFYFLRQSADAVFCVLRQVCKFALVRSSMIDNVFSMAFMQLCSDANSCIDTCGPIVYPFKYVMIIKMYIRIGSAYNCGGKNGYWLRSEGGIRNMKRALPDFVRTRS